MSIGGIIIDVVPVRSDKWWIDTLASGSDTRAGRTCAVYCNPLGKNIQPGDALWWQGSSCYWTPANRLVVDVKLPKLGYSGVPHPHKSKPTE
jgi:hypothetical protein